MIGAGCPVLPLRTGAGCLFHPSFVNVCVAFLPAGRCFISVLIVIGVSSTAAHDVVKNPSGCRAPVCYPCHSWRSNDQVQRK